MSDFDSKYGKYVNTLEDPGLDVAQQLVMTAGKSAGGYKDPTDAMVKKTLDLFKALDDFDTDPTDITFDNLKNALIQLQMKAVRVAGSPEWIYITPDADPVKEQRKWNSIALNTQFDLSWHVGSKSKVGCSDEHNGSDGSYRAVGELVKQGSNLKLVMSNSLHPKSGGEARNKGANWAHSKNTIDYPVMCVLAKSGFSIINVHGWASRDYGMFMNNLKREYTHERASLPTMIAIALTKYLPEKGKKFFFSGGLPGSIKINDVKRPLSPQSKSNSDVQKAVFTRSPGFYNTNVIGNAIQNINGYENRQGDLEDSGKSCHIEFGIIRDGRADLRDFVAAINLAAYWMNNYQPELNPWQVAAKNPNFDMRNYGDLFPANPELEVQFKAVTSDTAAVDSAKLVGSEDDMDEDEGQQNFEEDDAQLADNASVKSVPVKPLILSGGKLKDEQEKEVEKEDQATTPSTRRVKQKA